jgi:hypothetical protein
MRKRVISALCSGACLILIACPSRRSTPGSDKAAALRSRIDLLSSLLDERALPARIFEELNAALPVGAWLTEVTYDGAGVRANGCAPSNTVVADYVSRLGGSSVLTEVNLQTSIQRRIQNRDWQEFSVQAAVGGARSGKPSASGSVADSGDVAVLTGRLAELEKNLTAGTDSAGILRQFQLAADDSGLKISKFAPGNEFPRGFYSEWSTSIEVTGSRQSLGRFFDRVNEFPALWVVKRFTYKAVSNQDANSPIRTSLTAQTYILRETPGN